MTSWRYKSIYSCLNMFILLYFLIQGQGLQRQCCFFKRYCFWLIFESLIKWWKKIQDKFKNILSLVTTKWCSNCMHGHLMTKLLWKFGKNFLKYVGGVAHRRSFLCPSACPSARLPTKMPGLIIRFILWKSASNYMV